MANIRFNKNEKMDVEIIRCLLNLIPYWQKDLVINIEIDNQNEVIKITLSFLNILINNSDLENDELLIINDCLINKDSSNEYSGRKHYYSESGIRNKVNKILKKMIIWL